MHKILRAYISGHFTTKGLKKAICNMKIKELWRVSYKEAWKKTLKNVESKTERKDRLKGQETQLGERSRAGVLQNSYIRNEQKALNRNFFSKREMCAYTYHSSVQLCK